MKVLLDENLPPRLRFRLLPHDVYTAEHQGWRGFKNGALLALAEASHFEAFVTVDKDLIFQQNVTAARLGFIVLSSNLWPKVEPQVGRILEALDLCTPGSIQTIEL